MNIQLRRKLTRIVLTLLNWRDPRLAEMWFWNLTPMPIGLPTNRHLFDSFTIFWLGFRRLGYCMDRAERETHKAMQEASNG